MNRAIFLQTLPLKKAKLTARRTNAAYYPLFRVRTTDGSFIDDYEMDMKDDDGMDFEFPLLLESILAHAETVCFKSPVAHPPTSDQNNHKITPIVIGKTGTVGNVRKLTIRNLRGLLANIFWGNKFLSSSGSRRARHTFTGHARLASTGQCVHGHSTNATHLR